jgi:hypothetical protein
MIAKEIRKFIVRQFIDIIIALVLSGFVPMLLQATTFSPILALPTKICFSVSALVSRYGKEINL